MLLDSQAAGHWLKTSLNPLVQDMGTTCCKKTMLFPKYVILQVVTFIFNTLFLMSAGFYSTSIQVSLQTNCLNRFEHFLKLFFSESRYDKLSLDASSSSENSTF